ncbi:hypothetical protein D3C83_264930 [compost metagenome]
MHAPRLSGACMNTSFWCAGLSAMLTFSAMRVSHSSAPKRSRSFAATSKDMRRRESKRVST